MTARFFGYLSSLNQFAKCCLPKQKQGHKLLIGIRLLLFSSAPVLFASSVVPVGATPLEIAQITQVSINRPNLQLGSQGQPVSELQAALKLLGYYTGAVDGNYNQATAKAVSQFQQAAGLSPNGIVDAITWQRLFPGEAIASSTASTTSIANSASNFPVPTHILNNSTTTTTQTANNSTATTTQIANNSTVPTTTPEPKPATPPKQTTSTNSQKKTVTQSSSTRTQPNTRTQSTKRTQPNPHFEKIPGVQYTSKGYPILRLGMSNVEVRRLQMRLRKLGYLESAADGNFGEATEAAVKTLQRRYGIEPDGVVGGETWEILLRRR
ncbi:peptidoglycan-binding protein [Fischerella thermalis CCMEE 5198]|jgi:peptidoglycan hydrolase-like protein with peptidoglycan-binding domain|uniref:peptidoglycan-binding domain-containing protein n=1 Tax=Fischerella thermalis TaxID=372787 RepID=UPI000C7F9B65|nr:peptidoglycan-binding protein [Fischerella thermalis]PLZ87778.1 peptidoglycan-binding protein [Fischerella thermalis CCMEE 5196]PMB27137.1 peptidoglycan-binding protein [Fischerella thermalis CCMEE 5198]